MWLRLACLFGSHRRSRGRAWHDGATWRSQCARCGGLMIKDDGGWRLFDPDEDGPPPSAETPAAPATPLRSTAWPGSP